jgi:hypothetical protein
MAVAMILVWLCLIITLLVFGFTKASYRLGYQKAGKDYKNLSSNDAEEYFMVPICVAFLWPLLLVGIIVWFLFTKWTDVCTWVLTTREQRKQLETLERQQRIEELEQELHIE